MLPLKEILNSISNKYKTTISAFKVSAEAKKNINCIRVEDQKEKLAVVALDYVFNKKVEVTENQDVKRK
jgi:hypothetical protein